MDSKYLLLAKQTGEKERQKQWHEAERLWREALVQVLNGSKNHSWAWSRAEFCKAQSGVFH